MGIVNVSGLLLSSFKFLRTTPTTQLPIKCNHLVFVRFLFKCIMLKVEITNRKWSTKRPSQDDLQVLLYGQIRASSPFKRLLLNPKARMKNSGSQTFVSVIKTIIP